MNISNGVSFNKQPTTYNKISNRSNVSFGDLRRISRDGFFKDKNDSTANEIIESFGEADWKNELGKKYDYEAAFYNCGYTYYMELRPYSDEKSKLPPLPCEITYFNSSGYGLCKEIKDITMKNLSYRIKGGFDKLHEEYNEIPERACRLLEYVNRVNKGSEPIKGISLKGWFKDLKYSSTAVVLEDFAMAKWKDELGEKYSYFAEFSNKDCDCYMRLKPYYDAESDLPPLPYELEYRGSYTGRLRDKINKLTLSEVLEDIEAKRKEEQTKQEEDKTAQRLKEYIEKVNDGAGPIRGINLEGFFKDLKNSSTIGTIDSFVKADWKDELGKQYDFIAEFSSKSYWDNYHMTLKPYKDKDSKLPPLPCEIDYSEDSLCKLQKNIENLSVNDVLKKVESQQAKNQQKTQEEQEKAKTVQRLKEYIERVNDGSGPIRGITLEGWFEDLKYSPTAGVLDSFVNADWKDKLGEQYDYVAEFSKSPHGNYYYMTLKPYKDKDSKLPPLPCEVEYYDDNPYNLKKNIENLSVSDVLKKVESQQAKNQQKAQEEQEKAKTAQRLKEYITNVNNGSGPIRGITLEGWFKDLKYSPTAGVLDSFVNADWKDKLGEQYDYVAEFSKSPHGNYYYMTLKPYNDEKSNRPPLPCEVEYYDANPYNFKKTVENMTIGDVSQKIESGIECKKAEDKKRIGNVITACRVENYVEAVNGK